jgi:hypothetical protein
MIITLRLNRAHMFVAYLFSIFPELTAEDIEGQPNSN